MSYHEITIQISHILIMIHISYIYIVYIDILLPYTFILKANPIRAADLLVCRLEAQFHRMQTSNQMQHLCKDSYFFNVIFLELKSFTGLVTTLSFLQRIILADFHYFLWFLNVLLFVHDRRFVFKPRVTDVSATL